MKLHIKPPLNELYHYGILGMKWGVRRTQVQLGRNNLLKSRTANMEKWGVDPQHNILYITGYSGSGKSTVAKSLASENTNVIHLDLYFDKMDKNIASSIRDNEFNSFLKVNFPKFDTIANPPKRERHSKQWWDKVDVLMEQTEKFAEAQFYKNKKVVVEGVQLNDETTYPDKTFFKDKPLVITGTNAISSFFRAAKRDDKSVFTSIQSAKEYVNWYGSMNKSLTTLAKTSNVRKGNKWVAKHFNERRQ